MNIPLVWAASLLALFTFCVHTFVGGKSVARPLLADQRLPAISKWLNYMCWHMTTIMLLWCAVALAIAAWQPQLHMLVALIAGLAGVCSVWSAAVAKMAGFHPMRLPSTYLLGGLAALCVSALTVG